MSCAGQLEIILAKEVSDGSGVVADPLALGTFCGKTKEISHDISFAKYRLIFI